MRESGAPTAPHARTRSNLVAAVAVTAARKTKGLGMAAALLLGAGGGVFVTQTDEDRVGDVSRRTDALSERLSVVEREVAASDAGERLAGMEARLLAAEKNTERQDQVLARLTRGLEVQLQVSRSISGNLERIGRKLHVDLEPLPDDLRAEVNQMQLDATLRRVKETKSP